MHINPRISASIALILVFGMALPAASQIGAIPPLILDPGGESCPEARETEATLYRSHLDVLRERELDIQNRYLKESAACGNDQGCRKAAFNHRNDWLLQVGNERSDENTRHSKAVIELNDTICAPTPAGLPASPKQTSPLVGKLEDFTLDTLKSLLLAHLIPQPNGNTGTSTPTPATQAAIGNLAFLALTQSLLASMVEQLNQTNAQLNALRAKRTLTSQERTDLMRLTNYATTIQNAIRQMHLSYDQVRSTLSPSDAATFPPSSQLHFPY